jgi:hypothetical protein
VLRAFQPSNLEHALTLMLATALRRHPTRVERSSRATFSHPRRAREAPPPTTAFTQKEARSTAIT